MYTMVVVIYNRKVCKMAIFGGVLKTTMSDRNTGMRKQ
jgi:hypothetical protein